jgi:type IX secretion system PorP/SprF family membrane protein
MQTFITKPFSHYFSRAILLVGWGYLLTSFSVQAQDAQFSQYANAPLYLNPALSAAENNLLLAANYRTQWSSVASPYVTSQVSGIYPLVKGKTRQRHWGGAGLSLMNDVAGPQGSLQKTSVNASLAYNFLLTPGGFQKISVGVQAGIIQTSLNYSQAQWGEQYNPVLGFDPSLVSTETGFSTSSLIPDTQVGVCWVYNPSFNTRHSSISAKVGVSVSHLNQPNESLMQGVSSRLPMLYKAHAGFSWQLNERVALSPSFLLLYQNQVQQYLPGLQVWYLINPSPTGILGKCSLGLGGLYRNADAGITTFTIKTNRYTLGFSYDVNVSTLQPYSRSRGAYELALAYRINRILVPKKYSSPFL